VLLWRLLFWRLPSCRHGKEVWWQPAAIKLLLLHSPLLRQLIVWPQHLQAVHCISHRGVTSIPAAGSSEAVRRAIVSAHLWSLAIEAGQHVSIDRRIARMRGAVSRQAHEGKGARQVIQHKQARGSKRVANNKQGRQ
jgi:hypothetical protein